MLPDVIAVRLMGGEFNDAAENDVTGIGVRSPASRLKVELLVGNETHEFNERDRFCELLVAQQTEIIWEPTGMREEVSKRDLAGVRRLGKISGHFGINIELARILKLKDRCRGELLGDRPDFIMGVHARWKAPVKLAGPIRMLEK